MVTCHTHSVVASSAMLFQQPVCDDDDEFEQQEFEQAA